MNAIDSPMIFIIRIDLKKISLIKSTINDIETDIINSRLCAYIYYLFLSIGPSTVPCFVPRREKGGLITHRMRNVVRCGNEHKGHIACHGIL